MEKNVELEEWENAAIELNYHENVAMNYRLHYHPGLEVVFLFSGEMHLIVENEDIVQKHYREKITLDTVATEIRVNKYMISKIINGKMKTSFTDLVNQYRILDVSHLLRHTDLSLPKIAEQTGFSSVSAMYRNFQKTFHMSPKDYRAANQ